MGTVAGVHRPDVLGAGQVVRVQTLRTLDGKLHPSTEAMVCLCAGPPQAGDIGNDPGAVTAM